MGRSFEHCLRFTLDEHKVVATLRLEPGWASDELTSDAILSYLDSKAVLRRCVDTAAVDDIVAEALKDPDEPHERVIARGTPVEHGLDGRFEFVTHIALLKEQIEHRARAARSRKFMDQVDRTEPPPSGEETGDDPIDFYNLSSFIVVGPDEPIGRIEPPTSGTDGEDVYGNSIPATRGQHTEIKAGPGTKDDGSGFVIAAHAGKLDYEGLEIRVEPTLEIKAAVDFSTGNIDFPGDVLVRGGVRDRFEVKAGGRLTINDLVEAASLATLADLEMHAGMTGRGRGRIEIGGNARARYLDSVSGTVGGDLTIDRELNNCDLLIKRRLEASACTVRGGRIRVGQRAELASLGGAGEIETELLLGALPAIDTVAHTLFLIVDEISEVFAAASERLEKLRGSDAHGARHSELLTEATFDVENTRRQAADIHARLERIAQAAEPGSNVTLVVRKAIHPGTKIWFRGWRAQPLGEIRGPIVVDLSPDGEPQHQPLGGEGEPKPLSQLCEVARDNRLAPLASLRQRLADIA